MYTVVIADDEEEIRTAIVEKINWEAIGFSVVGQAENGMEAFELVERLAPDLLITDIRMPFLSGIELARQVRSVRPATHMVFISGYDDFAYAQQAIQYNIISYILKPINVKELTERLVEIKGKMDYYFESFASEQQVAVEKSEFVMSLILDGFSYRTEGNKEAIILNQAKECGLLPIDTGMLQYAVMVTSLLDDKKRNCTAQSNLHSVNSILEKYMRYFSFYSNGRIISLLIATPQTFERYLHILVEDINQSMERILQLSPRIGVSRISIEISRCHEAYNEAVNAMSYSERIDSKVHYISDEERASQIGTEGIMVIVGEIENIIRGGTSQELEEYLEAFFEEISRKSVSIENYNLLLVQALSSIYRLVYAVAETNAFTKSQTESLLKGMTLFHGTYEDTKEKFIQFCLHAKEMISSQRKKSSDLLCDQTLTIIEQRFAEADLSLVSISSEINVSPNYLSALIKKTTSQTFVDLLTRKRMEVAKELLLCSSMKIREITEKCGYSDQHYFSYCFKKYHGISPNVLRKQS